jgi:predicted transposase YbfD/YdcC
MALSSPENLFTHFSSLSDPRVERTKRHLLVDIIGLSICAVICGADEWTAIEEFGQSKEAWLRQFFALPNGIPSDSTIRRVFLRLSPTAFQACFRTWIHAVMQQTAGHILPIDGKTLRGSYDSTNAKAALHMVSAWASNNHLLLGQVKTAEKSNEITAIPELLTLLALEGCIVTIDAMGCQTAIAEQIVDQGGDYVLALKGNQGTTHQQVVDFFDQHLGATPESGATAPEQAPSGLPAVLSEEPGKDRKRERAQQAWEHATASIETVDGDHGRIEIRRYYQVSELSWLDERSHWKALHSIGMVESERHLGEQITCDRRYYISSLSADVSQFANAVRGHWGIENSVHWVLDVAFKEDGCRIRTGHAPENFAVLRHIALNVLRQDTQCRRGIATKRLKAGWDQDYLASLLTQAGGGP